MAHKFPLILVEEPKIEARWFSQCKMLPYKELNTVIKKEIEGKINEEIHHTSWPSNAIGNDRFTFSRVLYVLNKNCC